MFWREWNPSCNTHKKHDFDEQRWSQNKIPSMTHHHLSEDHTNSSDLLSIILDLERKIFATPPHWELSPLKDKVTWAALTISGLFIPAIETVKLSLNCVNKTTTEKNLWHSLRPGLTSSIRLILLNGGISLSHFYFSIVAYFNSLLIKTQIYYTWDVSQYLTLGFR